MRDILLLIKRWHFWVVCPLVVLLALGLWFPSVGSVKSATERNRSEINNQFQTVASVRNNAEHPNADVAEGMKKLIEKRRKDIATAWTEKYRQQTAEGGTLTWPAELGEAFIKHVRDLRPIEKTVDFPVPPSLQLIKDDRRRYQEHLANELPKLAKMIGAKWYLAEDPTTLEMGPEPGPERRRGERERLRMNNMMEGLNSTGVSLAEQTMVEWDRASQMQIIADHFPWGFANVGGEMPMSDRPSMMMTTGEQYPDLLEVLYAQEDLWVLQAIMNVIKKANEGATARFNATVKEVQFIRMGKTANKSAGTIFRSQAPAADAGGEGMTMDETSYEMPSGRREFEEGGEFDPETGEMMGSTRVDPAEGRYVDDQYAPLPAKTLRDVMREFASQDPSLAYLAVAKRIPVRLRVKLDQTGLDRLLVECANSPLTIEVRQIRINPDEADQSDGTFTSMPMMERRPGASRESSGYQMQQRTPFPSSLNQLTGPEAIDAQSSTEITVEIFGIVYIFNPVDPSVLGETSEDDAAGEEL